MCASGVLHLDLLLASAGIEDLGLSMHPSVFNYKHSPMVSCGCSKKIYANS